MEKKRAMPEQDGKEAEQAALENGAQKAAQTPDAASEETPDAAPAAPGGHNGQNRRITAILREQRGANAAVLGAMRRLRHENANLRNELAGK